MKVTLALLFLAAESFAACSNPKLRREWNQLSGGEKQTYLATLQTMKSNPPGSNPNNWNFNQFAEVHWQYQADNHGRPAFFPWHRAFLVHFENSLRAINPSVTLPYWDWSLNSQNPGASDLFSPNNFGGDGDPNNGNCVVDGVAANWVATANGAHCLRRCNSWGALTPPSVLAGYMRSAKDYSTFLSYIENSPHAQVHSQMGGRCGDFSTMQSANDPVFFLHHAMVDKIWRKWQDLCPEFEESYGNPDYNLRPFGVTVRDVLAQTDNYCYSYSSSGGDVPVSVSCIKKKNGETATGSATATATTGKATKTTATGTAKATSTASPTGNATVSDVNWLEKSIQQLVNASSQAISFNQAKLSGDAVLRRRMDDVLTSVVLPSPTTTSNATLSEPTSTPTVESVMRLQIDVPEVIPEKYEFNSNFTIVAPPASDRTDLLKIRHPTDLDEDFVKMMHLDLEAVRKAEIIAKMIVDEVNNDPNYVSPAALINFSH
ncbi:hypothetical protein BC833DRAFT_563666 [Globomyces pollinis-pini]|nr:hypothetical protein BC833DRAFT_563666 [Globomyces pollinis-pini]